MILRPGPMDVEEVNRGAMCSKSKGSLQSSGDVTACISRCHGHLVLCAVHISMMVVVN